MITYIVQWAGKEKTFDAGDDKANYIAAAQYAESLSVPARILRVTGSKREAWGGNILWSNYTGGRR